jgi:hypothetical protein
MKTYKTFLPVFSGFYSNPNFEPNFEQHIDYIHEQRAENKLPVITDIDLDFDYTKFNQDVSKELCDYIETEFNNDCDVKISIKFEKLVSPRFYNYTNDVINCEIKCDLDVLLQICSNHLEQFTQYVSDNFTSCSGFSSFHSNDVNDWLDVDYINENTEYRIGAILDFICKEIYEIGEPNLYDLDICDSNYFTNTDYWLEFNPYVERVVKVETDCDLEKAEFWFRNWSGLNSTEYEVNSLDKYIKFKNVTNIFKSQSVVTQLEISPLIDFNYTFEFLTNFE